MFESSRNRHYIMESKMDKYDELRKQAILRIALFFAIAIVVGFVVSDINILMSQ